MDQKLFEQLIAPYVRPVVDTDNSQIVHFELVRRPKTVIWDRKGRVTNTRQALGPGTQVTSQPGRTHSAVFTPAGRFDSVTEAADHYQVSPASIYARIRHNRNRTNREYYLDGK